MAIGVQVKNLMPIYTSELLSFEVLDSNISTTIDDRPELKAVVIFPESVDNNPTQKLEVHLRKSGQISSKTNGLVI